MDNRNGIESLMSGCVRPKFSPKTTGSALAPSLPFILGTFLVLILTACASAQSPAAQQGQVQQLPSSPVSQAPPAPQTPPTSALSSVSTNEVSPAVPSSSVETVSGHVRGPGGVSVPGATVLLVNPQTGERKETWSDESGNYAFRNVPPGTYRLEVSLVGFGTDVREPVPVTTGQPLTVNVKLTLASSSQGEASASKSAQPGGYRIPRGANGQPDLSQLPPEARARIEARMAQQGGEMGGVESAGGEASLRFSESGLQDASGEEESTGGGEQASANNSFLLNGSTAEAPVFGANGRMMMMTGQFGESQGPGQQGAPGFGGAGGQGGGGPQGGGGGFGGGGFGGGGGGRFGGGGGGGQNVIGFFAGLGGRRPRVNRLRGNFLQSYTNSVLDARPYPLNVASSPRIPAYTEQTGISIGGPLVIPHVVSSKNNTNFFVNYNLQHSKSAVDSYSTVPSALERAGNFSETVIPAGVGADTTPTIYEPQAGALGPRTPFPDNTIPSSMLNPAALGLLQYIPLPNVPASVQNFHLQESLPSTNQRLMARIGQQIGKRDSLSGMYYLNSTHTDSVSSFPDFTSRTTVRQQNLTLNESHTFTPQVVNTVLFNFNRSRTFLSDPFANTENVAAELGITGVSEDPLNWGLPAISFTNFGGLGLAIPSLTRNQTTRAVDTMIVNHGKNNFRFGGELRHVQVNTLTDPNARGTFTFTGYTTSDFTATGQPVDGTGFDFADFLLGLPYSTSVRYGTSANYLRAWYSAGFVQDDWRATSKFTILAGLRYEYFQPFIEKYGHLSDLELGPDFSSATVVTGQNPNGLPPSLLRGQDTNFTPRIGIAYRPWTKSHFVIRTGYGMFYDESIYQRLATGNLVSQPPFATSSTLVTSPAQPLTLQNGFPAVGPNILTNTYAVDPGYHTPYAQTWNFTLQNEIFRNVILDVGYLGTVGRHLDLLLGPNPAGSNNTPNALQYTYETAGANSNYNALQISLRRQFHRGLSIWGRYTYSKALDDASSIGGLAGTGSVVAQNYLDPAAEYGLSSFDRRHQFLLNYNYELPFGDRKRFLNHGGPLEHIFGNWQWSGVTTIEAGTPSTAYVQGNVASNGRTGAYYSLRADATGESVSLPGSQRTTLEYFNTAAFTLPPAGELGNAGVDTIPGPPTYNFNMSLDRQIVFNREKGINGDFRVAANNVFNTANFSGLGTVVNSVNFGRVTGVGSMRSVTFSFRLRF